MRLENKVAIVTGASSGIGEATALALANEGAIVVLAARRLEKLEQLNNKINAQGGKAIALRVDISKKDQVDHLINQTITQLGNIDFLINNAGIMLLSFLEKAKVEEWDRMIDVNIKGVLYGINGVLPIMLKNNYGHIVNIASVAGHGVFPSSAVYSGTKYAVRAVSEGLRLELSEHPNIRVTTISPGAVATELTTHITDKDVTDMFSKRKFEFLQSEDIANAVIYALTQPERVDINEILVRPSAQRH